MPGITIPASSTAGAASTIAPTGAAPGVPSLAAFIDLMDGQATPAPVKAPPGGIARQDDADTGNPLPDDGDDQPDPALAWMLAMPAVVAPLPTPASPVGGAGSAMTADTPSSVGNPAKPAPAPLQLADAPPSILVADPAVATPESTPAPIAVEDAKPATPAIPVRVELPRQSSPRLLAQVPTPVQPVQTAAPVVQPALFALAGLAERTPLDRDDRTGSPVAEAMTQIQAATTNAVTPAGDAQQQSSLDMGHRDWPQKMIDHIDALRDQANANDTSIRLKPEALGRVDVSLRTHDNGTISVRFTAEQPTTRTLLADAAPQLAQAAEARGIRLSGTSVDLAGSGQGDHRPRPEAERRQPITNHAAPRGDDTDVADDGRIA